MELRHSKHSLQVVVVQYQGVKHRYGRCEWTGIRHDMERRGCGIEKVCCEKVS